MHVSVGYSRRNWRCNLDVTQSLTQLHVAQTIDKLSEGELFSLYPVIPWKEIMKLRDVIAHHYLKIDVDIVYSTMKEDLPLLQATLLSMKQAILS